MNSENTVWVFTTANGRFPGGVFSTLELANKWITENKLSGTLTKYPLDQGTFDWAVKSNLTNLKPEKMAVKRQSPEFIGSFTTATQEHFHYENGLSVST